MKQSISRREARRHAFNLIFGMSFSRSSIEVAAKAKADYFEFLDDFKSEEHGIDKLSHPKGKNADYINRAFWGVFDRLDEIDQVITNFLRNWSIDRINRADLAIMRLAIYEMICEEIPFGAAVNEAVELAKEYGLNDSPAFVNGVLGNVAVAFKESRSMTRKLKAEFTDIDEDAESLEEL